MLNPSESSFNVPKNNNLEPTSVIDAEEFLKYLHLLASWYEQPEVPILLLNLARERARLLFEGIPEVLLAVGSGYPYYAISNNPNDVTTYTVPEFSRYFSTVIEETSRKNVQGNLRIGKKQGDMSWNQIFRCIPDLDIFIIVNDVTEQVKRNIEQVLMQWPFINPSASPQQAIKISYDFLNDFLKQDMSRLSIAESPIRTDLLLATAEEFDRAFKEISKGNLTGSRVSVKAYGHDGKNWVEYNDVLAEDLFTARSLAPLFAGQEGEKLFQKWWDQIKKYVERFENTEEVFSSWIEFLKENTNGKNSRIICSSEPIKEEMKRRIDAFKK